MPSWGLRAAAAAAPREALSGRPTSALTSILADVLGPGVRFPDLAAAIRAEVERRAEEIATQRRDVRRAPARIEARASARH